MRTALTLASILCFFYVTAQPGIQWQRSYGGVKADNLTAVFQTADSGFIAIGTTASDSYNISGSHGSYDYWVLKVNRNGDILWQKCYGGSDVDEAQAAFQLSDGGYIITGNSGSTDGDVLNGISPNSPIFWTIRIDSSGNLKWQKAGLQIHALQELATGGFIAAGVCKPDDYWIVNLDDTLGVRWQKCYGGSKADVTNDIQATFDGGFIVTGVTQSTDGNITDYQGDHQQVAWVLKLNDTGAIQWSRTYKDGTGVRIRQCPDSNFLLGGTTTYGICTATGVHGPNEDYWLTKLNAKGDTLWDHAYGSRGIELLYDMQLTRDGGCILAGVGTSTVSGDIDKVYGHEDMWIAKVNSTGILTWESILGGTFYDGASSIKCSFDGGYIVGGYSGSNDGDVTAYLGGGSDFWLVKLNREPLDISSTKRNFDCLAYPNPTSGFMKLSVGSDMLNKTVSVLDMYGRTVLSQPITQLSTTLYLQALVPGVYILKIGAFYYESRIVKL